MFTLTGSHGNRIDTACGIPCDTSTHYAYINTMYIIHIFRSCMDYILRTQGDNDFIFGVQMDYFASGVIQHSD